MSIEVFDRATTREVWIWALPKIDILRAMGAKIGIPLLTLIIPLEDDRFLQDFYLIQEHEVIKYDQLIAVLVAELAKINAERTMTLANIATKRLEKELEFQARDRKLDNKIFSNIVAAALMDAQFYSLLEDQARLLTKQQQIDTAWKKANAEIAEIQSKILLEEGNLLLAEIDTFKAQQDLVKKDLEILQAQLRVVQIALDVVQTMLEVTNTLLEKINIPADIRMLEADILRTGLSFKHLTAEQRELVVEFDGITRRLASDLSKLHAQETTVQEDIADTQAYYALLASLLVAQLAAEVIRGLIAQQDETATVMNANTKVSGIAAPEAQSRIQDAQLKRGVSLGIAGHETQVGLARRVASQTETDARISAAVTKAKSDVTSKLMHVIGSVT